MSDWRLDMHSALADFRQVADLAGHPIVENALQVEFHPTPHRPTGLPKGKMAVYCFWWNGEWLKIGKVGPNSDARYRSQHYSVGRAASSLANSLIKDERFREAEGFSEETIGDWIKSNTSRCNVLIGADEPRSLLSLLEAFLHQRLGPRYEG